jgi:hypothetical protein
MNRILQPKTFVNRLRPTKSVLAIGDNSGLAISDPYLSCACPLPLTATLNSLKQLLAEHGVGGIVLMPTASDFVPGQLHIPSQILMTEWTTTITLLQARKYASDDLLWSDIHLEDVDDNQVQPNTQAAIALQHFLYSHCGGWSNTFG